MAKFYKFINSKSIEKAPNPIHDKEKGIKIANPTEEILREYGYKELIDTEYPDTEEGYYREFEYVEDETLITKIWSESKIIEATIISDNI